MTDETGNGLRLETRRLQQAVVLSIAGSVDMAGADEFVEQLAELTAEEVPLIILDLSRMEFISSQGLGAIITAHLKSRHYNGQIRLADPRPAVRELLDTTRLTKLFPIFPSVEAALESP